MPHSIKTSHRRFWSPALIALAVTSAAPGWAAGVSQSDFAQALRPVPAALQRGHQGLPTFGHTTPAEPNPAYVAAAVTTSSAGERRSVVRQNRHGSVQSDPVRPAGCSVQALAEPKPMIGFKVAFEFGSARLRPESLETLRNLGKALNENLRDQARFDIEGHTDATGSFEYNQQLSMARAEAVKEFLVHDMAVAPERLVAVGKAYCEPINPRQPYAADNRRVVVLNQSS